MAQLGEGGGAFAIPGLFPISSLANLQLEGAASEADRLSPFIFSAGQESYSSLFFLPQTSFELLRLDVSSDDPLQTSKSLGAEHDGALPFSYGPLEDPQPLDQSSASSNSEEQVPHDDPLEDLWSSRDILEPAVRQLDIKSWEKFHDESFKEPAIPYMSEAGPQVFDAALDHGLSLDVDEATPLHPAPALRPDAVLSSLLQLALGRESLLFRYDEKGRTFQPVLGEFRMSGYTMKCFHGALATFIRYGNQLRQAKGSFREMHSSNKSIAALTALASGTETIITALDIQLSASLASVKTVLQLQALLDPSQTLLHRLSDITEKASQLEDDEDILSILFSCMQNSEGASHMLQTIVEQLLAHCSRPWLDSLEGSLGLRARNVNQLAKAEAGDNQYSSRKMPDFIRSQLAESIQEAEQSLKLLQTHGLDHPLTRSTPSSEPPALQWLFSSPEIEKIQAQAHKYESDVLQALKEYSASGFLTPPQTHRIDDPPQPPSTSSEVQPNPNDVLAQIDCPLPTLFNPAPTPFSRAVAQSLLHPSYSPAEPLVKPPNSLLPTLSFCPLLSAQSRLLSHSTLQLLFHTHHLRSHLRLLHSYTLFANGPFSVRLSHALFDPSLPSAAYQKGRIRSSGNTGLQLGARKMAWPPASSELRIALTGILTESYHGSPEVRDRRERGRDKGELPGDLSFAIRSDLSDIELEACMNKDGLEALDFLKIQYRPPKPLDVIITEGLMEKYDRLSRMLLRGARLQFVVKSLMQHPRKSMLGKKKFKRVVQRFKVEAHHFVMTVFGYFADRVQELWMAFEGRLDGIERSLECYDVGRQIPGVHRLRDLHEEVLDWMLAACLLRKRQELVMRLLEEILCLVLGFARALRDGGDEDGEGEELDKLYEAFRKKVRVFITVCRGLQDQKILAGKGDLYYGVSKGEDRGNGIGRLVLGLEMNGWYMR